MTPISVICSNVFLVIVLDFHGACSFYRDAYPTIGRQRDLVVCRLGFFLSFSKACFGITLHCAPVSILKWMFSSFMFKFVNSSFLSFCDDSSSPRKRSSSVSVSDCFPDLVKLLVVRIWALGETHVGKMIFGLTSMACGTKCFTFSWFVVRATTTTWFFTLFLLC